VEKSYPVSSVQIFGLKDCPCFFPYFDFDKLIIKLHIRHDSFLRKCTSSGLPDFSWFNVPKFLKMCQIVIVPIYHMAIKYTNDQMVIIFTNNFHFKALQNIPKLGLCDASLASGNPAHHPAIILLH
jgi:hypothetical protein